MRRCPPVLLALYLVSAATACVPSQSAPARSTQSSESARSSSAATSQAKLSERPATIEPGFEKGFTHCCGDIDYVMQVDCGEGLLRCYANKGGGWKQTYGRNCKSALGAGCYERGCLDVCE